MASADDARFGKRKGTRPAAVELPVNADYCAIYRALTNRIPPDCAPAGPAGAARSIIPRTTTAPEEAAVYRSTRAFGPQFAEETPSFMDLPTVPLDNQVKNRTAQVRVASAQPRALKYGTQAVAAATTVGGPAAYFIHFAFDSSSIGNDYQKHLDQLSKVLQTSVMQNTCLRIVGHTDAVGNADYNQVLSEKRAQMVRGYLVGEGGLAEGRVITKGVGEATPIDGIDPLHPRNRRVEFQVRENAAQC